MTTRSLKCAPVRGVGCGRAKVTIKFEGESENEVGIVGAVTDDKANCKVGDIIVKMDLRYYRRTEVVTLLGYPAEGKQRLGWEPTITFEELVKEMIEADHTTARKDSLVELAGFQAFDSHV